MTYDDSRDMSLRRRLGDARQPRAFVRGAVGSLLLAFSAACYQYTPMVAPVSGAGEAIRVDLTDAGSVQLAPSIGQRVESIDGRSVALSDSALAVSVSATISQGGTVAHWNNERVEIPRNAISRIRGRRLDTKRTYMVSALTVVGAFAIGKVFGLNLTGGGGPGKGNGTKQ